jgi:flagellar basal-body rod protein FlgG
MAGLSAIGKNLFMETDASGTPVTGSPNQNGLGSIRQGYLEMSNVNIVQEMVNMIISQRAYEVNSKAIQTADEFLKIANNVSR